MTLILAVDPGFAATGLALMEKADDGNWVPLELKCVRTEKNLAKHAVRVADDDAARIQFAAKEISDMILHNSVKRMVVELPDGGGQSARAVRAMALATGMIVTLAEAHNVAVEYYRPADTRAAAGVPKSVQGRDKVKEIVMAEMAKRYPSLADFGTKAEREHIADALSCFEAALLGNLVRTA